jgi:hypothetical protein
MLAPTLAAVLAPLVAVVDLVGVGAQAAIDTSDCELVRSSFPTQPINTWTSLAYCVAGVWVMVAADRSPIEQAVARAAGGLFVLTGLGSVAYHGFGGELSGWFHDASFLWALGFMVACEGVARPSAPFQRTLVFGATVIGAASAVPALTNVVLVVLLGLLAWVETERWAARPTHERRDLGVVAGVLVLAGLAYLLGRSGGPACEPDSLIQGHGAWHLLTALALALWARVAFSLLPLRSRG